jgi:hypothetical protein
MIEPLCECDSREEAYERERELIVRLGTHVDLGVGYNVVIGKGGSPGMLGKKHSDETRRKMSESQKGRKHTAESKLKMSETRKGMRYPKRWKKIEQLDDQECVIATHYSFDDAAKAAGGGRSHIWECCQGKRKKTRGFAWRYASTSQ